MVVVLVLVRFQGGVCYICTTYILEALCTGEKAITCKYIYLILWRCQRGDDSIVNVLDSGGNMVVCLCVGR